MFVGSRLGDSQLVKVRDVFFGCCFVRVLCSVPLRIPSVHPVPTVQLTARSLVRFALTNSRPHGSRGLGAVGNGEQDAAPSAEGHGLTCCLPFRTNVLDHCRKYMPTFSTDFQTALLETPAWLGSPVGHVPLSAIPSAGPPPHPTPGPTGRALPQDGGSVG